MLTFDNKEQRFSYKMSKRYGLESSYIGKKFVRGEISHLCEKQYLCFLFFPDLDRTVVSKTDIENLSCSASSKLSQFDWSLVGSKFLKAKNCQS